MSIFVAALLQAAGGEIGAEAVKALAPLCKKGGRKIKEWLEQSVGNSDEEQNTIEVPADIREEMQEIARQYIAERKSPVFMGGVVYFFQEPLSDEVWDHVKSFLLNVNPEEDDMEWDTPECETYQAMVDTFINEYMDQMISEREGDFGREGDTFYLNFTDTEDFFRLCNEEEIREMADALNHLLHELDRAGNTIESYMIF